MRAVKYVLIEVDKEYNNEVELTPGLNIVTNTTIESVANVNRIVDVVSAPSNTILESGDKIIVHHNILRKTNDLQGKETMSTFYLGDPYWGMYFVPPTQIFAYKRDGVWKGMDPFVFIKPIKKTPEKTNTGIFLDTGAHTKYEPNTGTIQLINEELTEWGLKKGDQIFFSDESEYEFEIEGELLYKMSTSDILGKF